MNPRFSVIIPTKDRFETFQSTFRSVVSQSTTECEIVVADNASQAEVKKFVESFPACKVNYIRSESVLSMSENWTRGIEAARGTYITVLGDDDALMPDALSIAGHLIDQTKAAMVSWKCHTYWWPNAIVEHMRNLLFVNYTHTIQYSSRNSIQLLSAFYNGECDFSELPMLYNSFVHREILDAISAHWGSYFPVDHCPDIVSGIFNSLHTESFVHCLRPLAIRANSGKSNGTAFYARSKGSSLRQDFLRAERQELHSFTHPQLIPSPNVIITIASTMLHCHDLLASKGFQLPKPDVAGIVTAVIKDLPREPESYEDNLQDARDLAKKIGFKIEDNEIPPNPGVVSPAPRSGVSAANLEKGMMNITIDGNVAGFSDVYAASLVAASLIPTLN